jgi:hypothetical protein
VVGDAITKWYARVFKTTIAKSVKNRIVEKNSPGLQYGHAHT